MTIVIITGIGINPIFPLPIFTKVSDNFDIGVPFVNTNVAPLNIVIVASVTINACNLPFDINIPFINPITIPVIAATKIAKGILFVDFNIDAAKAPLIATVDPTDRSIPPVRITNVIPIAIIAFVETCVKIFVILDRVMNAGDTMVITTHKTIKPISDLYLSRISLKLLFIFNSSKLLINANG
ncbi:hypothetical protein MOUSESFB_0644 [Candidatus Arthromitus sp. SFB-mouse-Yit]|nr:hypothetical protein MOUSESFB_0644 [Candidatus Arthromitus sp. SFB-mouse-Yit]